MYTNSCWYVSWSSTCDFIWRFSGTFDHRVPCGIFLAISHVFSFKKSKKSFQRFSWDLYKKNLGIFSRKFWRNLSRSFFHWLSPDITKSFLRKFYWVFYKDFSDVSSGSYPRLYYQISEGFLQGISSRVFRDIKMTPPRFQLRFFFPQHLSGFLTSCC